VKQLVSFLTACVVLAIAQSLVAALGMALLIFALMGAISHPRETFGFAFCLGMLILALHAPTACAAALGMIGIAAVITGQIKRAHVPEAKAPPPLLARNWLSDV
jgi:membrane-bound ClpP family serine protease